MLRIAIIDVGSNSIKLLVAEKNNFLCKELRGTRISTGISQNKPELTAESIDNGIKSISELSEIAAEYHPSKTLIVATSAVREASNASVFCQKVKQATGHDVHVLSGEAEARGIAEGILIDPEMAGHKDFSLFDLGGGSLECIQYNDKKLTLAESLPLGAVRLKEKFITEPSRPTKAADLEALKAYVQARLPDAFPNKELPLVGMGGGLSVLSRIFSEQRHFSKEAIFNFHTEICQMSLEERLKNPNIPRFRADILPAALAIVLTLMERAQADHILYSPFNLRYGLAHLFLSERGQVLSEILGHGSY